jgi:hypothetical protein
MTPEELRRFAVDYLEPRLPWLVRHDLPWTEPSDNEWVCPTEFVLTPVGPIKCDFGMTLPPTDLGRATSANVGFGFMALYVPFDGTLGVALRRGRAPWARWQLPAEPGEETAVELVRAIEAQWPSDFKRSGTVEGLIESLHYDADQDPQMLEVLAYSQAATGDCDAALLSLREAKEFPVSEVDAARVSEMETLLQSDPPAALDRLASWRLEHLRRMGLLEVAASWHPGETSG